MVSARIVAVSVVLCVVMAGAVACGGSTVPADDVPAPAGADVWHPVPVMAGECPGAGAAAVALLRDSGGSVPVEVWEHTHANRVVGEWSDVEAFRAWVAEGVASVPADVRAELAASSWPVGWPVKSCAEGVATVGVLTTDGTSTVETTVVVVERAVGWVLVAPPGGTWHGSTVVVGS